MKKVLFLLTILIASLAFFSCGEEKFKIGLSLPTQREERWVRDKIKMLEVAKKLGVELMVQVSDNDQGKQTSQCENLISQGVKVLIVAPHDASASSTIIEKAHKSKIPVISYDRLIMNSNVDVYISFDNVKVGELQGEYLTKLVPKGNYVILSGAPTDNNATLFKEGAMKFIKPLVDKGDIRIVMEQAVIDWQPANAQKLMENALTANNNDIQAVLAPNDGTSGGCIQALAGQKLSGKVPITGQDAELQGAQRIVQGTQTMTILKDTRFLGEKAIEIAMKLAKGEKFDTNGTVNNGKIDVLSILLTPIVVDKANIDEVLIESGYLNKEDVYKK
ncbi:MAG: D-xylose transporter subunit XylF [Spirochaetes bacterium GWD1_27_9]|nr:MAG: D-xylose transporter subunit XylF [Spirochaetes bacterium GWB1_27_13]OHD20415.1 MAG: D-xylose transporter subunit XylF [Spirochaetes bacterium GWC1_27_15]OHD31987.1 MAG: D-xylose transporter subunit XylF [Spirochaetes bacterium GWD1_27_9]